MKKEVIAFIAICLFIGAYILDYFAGNLNLGVVNPLDFLRESTFKAYPMTFVSVILRSIALAISTTLVVSMLDRQYFKKAAILSTIGFIAQIYSFQILATNSKVTPLLWTLAISYSGFLLAISVILYILTGIYFFLIPPKKEVFPKTEEVKPSQDSGSILNP